MTATTTTRPGWATVELAGLPLVVIGAGPIGVAAAGHLHARGLNPVVLEAGAQVGAATRAWGHIRTFTPWRYIVDAQAEKLLAPTGWTRPPGDVPPPALSSSGPTLSRSPRCCAPRPARTRSAPAPAWSR
jgi:hypothetical protein